METNFYVDQPVISKTFGLGKVTVVDTIERVTPSPFRITVCFKYDIRIFTADGRYCSGDDLPDLLPIDDVIGYQNLALQQFTKLKEDSLDKDKQCVGAFCEKAYAILGNAFIIKVNGFWGSQLGFEWTVTSSNGNLIDSGYFDFT